MGSILGGSKQPKFIEPKAVEPPAAAVQQIAAPVADVSGGGSTDASTDELRKRYRPTRSGIGSTGTGLSV